MHARCCHRRQHHHRHTRQRKRCNADACASQSSRGQGANAIYGDEIAFQEPRWFFDGVGPIITAGLTCFVGTTSVAGATNWLTRMTQLKWPDGKPMLRTYALNRACDRCVRAGKEILCTHSTMVEGKDTAMMKLHERIYKLMGYEDAFSAEHHSLHAEGARPVFAQHDVELLLDNMPYGRLTAPEATPAFVVLAADPSGGGGSGYGFTGLYVDARGRVAVCARCQSATLSCWSSSSSSSSRDVL